MTNKSTYISLGPTCVPAEILKSSNLRRFSYGFDWCRSGSYFFSQFFKYSLEIFLEKYVNQPVIPLYQITPPELLNNNTSEVNQIQQVYGFPYIYFPHRNYLKQDTIDYFYRSFQRLKISTSNKSIRKYFLIADYANKEGAKTIPSIEMSVKFIHDILASSNVDNYEVCGVKICLMDKKISKIEFDKAYIDGHSNLTSFKINAPRSIDDESVRNSFYRKIAKILYPDINYDLLLDDPLRKDD